MKKIVICHHGFTGYAAACWKCLGGLPEVTLKVFTLETHHGYDVSILNGISHEIFPDAIFCAKGFSQKFVEKVVAEKPDVILISGWGSKPFVRLLYDARLRGVRKLMQVDTMWQWNLRCLVSRWYLRRFVRQLDGIIVAGDRGRMFARYVGFKPNQIFTSTYGYDAEAFADCYGKRVSHKWPRRFVFVGRLVPIKGIDTLIKAYVKYRQRFGDDAWELYCYGKGLLESALENVPGVIIRGFLQPKNLPSALTEAGVFVLPSIKDPWGVALVEGAGAGLPLVASDEVSSSVDVLRHLYNGCVFPARDEGRLFDALVWIHEHYERLPEMGWRSKCYAGAYAPEVWSGRILHACQSMEK